MDLHRRTGGLLVLMMVIPDAEAALAVYDPKMCYILDGFLIIYGLVITAMFIKEKWFKKKEEEESIYTDLKGHNKDGGYGEIRRDAESGAAALRGRRGMDDTYTGLKKRTEDEYKELPVKKQQPGRNRNDAVYQGLSSTTKDTYDSLQMKNLAR